MVLYLRLVAYMALGLVWRLRRGAGLLGAGKRSIPESRILQVHITGLIFPFHNGYPKT